MLIEEADDRRRRLGRRQDEADGDDLEAGHALLRYRWNARDERRGLRGGDAQRLHLAVFQKRDDGPGRGEDHLHFIGQQAKDGGPGRLVGHAREFGARRHHEKLAGEMQRGAARAGTVVHYARPGARQRDELTDVVDLQSGCHHQHVRRSLEQRDRREVRDGVVVYFFHQGRVLHRAAADHERVAVGRRAGRYSPYQPARAVVDDNLLPERIAERWRDDAREKIVAATRRRRDDAHRPGGILVLRLRYVHARGGSQRQRYGNFPVMHAYLPG